MKDMIRRSGENIAAAEVEGVIMRHPGVRLSAVLAVEDDLREEDVMAYVVTGDGVSREEVSPAALSAFCAKQLARFKVPRYWKYRDDLPRTPPEHVRKEALREGHADTRGPAARIAWRSAGADAPAVATGYAMATASISTSQSGSARLVTTANVLAGR